MLYRCLSNRVELFHTVIGALSLGPSPFSPTTNATGDADHDPRLDIEEVKRKQRGKRKGGHAACKQVLTEILNRFF